MSRSGLVILCGKTSGYFLTSERSSYFRFISGYVLASDVGIWSTGSQTSLTSFCWYIHFLSELYFQSEFHFRFDVHTSPSRARDRVTMAEAGPAPGRVTAGVGSVSRGAGTEPNSPDRSVRPTLRFGSVHIYYRQFGQIT